MQTADKNEGSPAVAASAGKGSGAAQQHTPGSLQEAAALGVPNIEPPCPECGRPYPVPKCQDGNACTLSNAECLWPDCRFEHLANERFAELQRAQTIIDGLKEYRERLLTCRLELEPAGRARIKDLCTLPRDDHDRAVLLLIADHERLIRAVAAPITPIASSDHIQDAANQAASANVALVAVLKHQLERRIEMIESGDCGFWDPNKDSDVIEMRAALAKSGG